MRIVVAADESFGLVEREDNLALLAIAYSLAFVNDFVRIRVYLVSDLRDLAVDGNVSVSDERFSCPARANAHVG